jgi:hypothetical protein
VVDDDDHEYKSIKNYHVEQLLLKAFLNSKSMNIAMERIDIQKREIVKKVNWKRAEEDVTLCLFGRVSL